MGRFMKIPFYILGLLMRYGPQHGYRIRQIMEEEIADFARIKLPTIYYHLEKLLEKGCVSAVEERDGNRPEKTVYRITDEGRRYFLLLLHRLMNEEYCSELPYDGVLYFSEHTQEGEIRAGLERRKEDLEHRLAELEAHRSASMRLVPPEGRRGAGLIFSHHLAHLQAELEWTRQAVEAYSDPAEADS